MIAFFVGAGMAVTVDLWQLLTVIGGMLACTALLVLYLDGRFGKLLPTATYETRHRELEERIRKLELWAARKNGPPT